MSEAEKLGPSLPFDHYDHLTAFEGQIMRGEQKELLVSAPCRHIPRCEDYQDCTRRSDLDGDPRVYYWQDWLERDCDFCNQPLGGEVWSRRIKGYLLGATCPHCRRALFAYWHLRRDDVY